MNKLRILIIILGILIIYQLFILFLINQAVLNQKKELPYINKIVSLSDLAATPSESASILKSWRDLLHSSFSVSTYTGSLERVEFDQVYDLKAPLVLTFNAKKHQVYFFSEEDIKKTKFMIKGEEVLKLKDLNIKKGDKIALTVKTDTLSKKIVGIVLSKE